MKKLLLLSALFSSPVMAAPDYIDLRFGLNQHNNVPSVCRGSGMSRHLTSRATIGAVWLMQKDFFYRASYSAEYCMMNDKSEQDGIYTLEVGYKFDL